MIFRFPATGIYDPRLNFITDLLRITHRTVVCTLQIVLLVTAFALPLLSFADECYNYPLFAFKIRFRFVPFRLSLLALNFQFNQLRLETSQILFRRFD